MKRRAKHRTAKRERTKMLRAAAAEAPAPELEPPVGYTPPANLVADLPPGTLRADDPDGLLYEAVCQRMWPAFILWARDNAEICERFTAETGLKVDRNRSPIEALVDKVTGYAASVADRFVEWVTVEIYGIEGAPAAYRAELARRRQEAA